MNHRELATALSALPVEAVQTLVAAADSIRAAEANLAELTGKKARKKRGPNKPKEVAPEPVVRPGGVRTVEAPKPRGRKPAPKPLASAIDRLRAVKAGGIKTRKQVLPDDED